MAAKKRKTKAKGTRKVTGPVPAEPDPLELEEALDALYRAPLADFIAARKELAERFRRTEAGARVAKLTKPVVSAWVTNVVALEEEALVDALREAGDEVRRVQSGGGATSLEEHREAAERRRVALEAALDAAEERLLAAGQAAAKGTLLKVRSSLESLAIYGTAADPEPPPGRLATDIEPPGLDVLAQLALKPRKGKARPKKAAPARAKKSVARQAAAPKPAAPRAKKKRGSVKKPTAAQLRRADNEVRRAEASVREAGARRKSARRAREGAERSLERVRERLREAEQRFEAAAQELKAAESELHEAKERAEEALAARRTLDAD